MEHIYDKYDVNMMKILCKYDENMININGIINSVLENHTAYSNKLTVK